MLMRLRRWSEPAVFLGPLDRLGTVARPGLGDGGGQVVADRSLGQEQLPGDLRNGGSRPGGHQDVTFAGGQRRCPGGQRLGGKSWVDDTLSRRDPADGGGKLLGRGVLDHETAGPRLHRPAQVAGAAERGEDDRPALRRFMREHSRGSQAVEPGHLDVQQRHVRVVLPGRGGYLVAAADRRDDLEVLFQREHHRQRAADELLVVGEQQSDQRQRPCGAGSRLLPAVLAVSPAAGAVPPTAGASTAGTHTRSRQPAGCTGPASTPPPAAPARSRSPDSPFPGAAADPWPSSMISTQEADTRTSQECARAWRITLVSPSRTAQPNSSWCSGPTTSVAVGRWAVIPEARSSSRPRASSLDRVTSRYPDTAARTSASARRQSSSTSVIWSTAPAGSCGPSLRARPAFTVIVVSEWPRRSCRSRAIRIRSFSAASRASSARVSASAWLARTTTITPAIVSATTGIAMGVTSANDLARLTCQGLTATGTSSAASAVTATNGAERAPRRATASSVRNTHKTKPAARANGISATVSATRSAYQAQNRSPLVCPDSTKGVTSQHAANTASSV